VPAHPFCEEAVLVEDAADGIKVRFAACGAGEAPAGEFGARGRGVVGEEAGLEDATRVEGSSCLVVACVVVDDEEDVFGGVED
jgi:hypothetical protein